MFSFRPMADEQIVERPSNDRSNRMNTNTAVYLVGQLEVTDPENYAAEYGAHVGSLLAEHGGEVLAVSPQPDVLEGRHDGRAVVVIRFPSADAASDWYNSDAYAPLKAVRAKYTNTDNSDMLLLPAFAGMPE